MRTDVSRQHQHTSNEPRNCESLEIMKARKSLHPLQESAGDKENLVGSGRMPPSGKDADKSLKKVTPIVAVSKVGKKKHPKIDKKITAEDLTSQAGPSDRYWEVIAERRRVALDEALKENRQLHEVLAALREENEQCKTLLEESKAVIESLTEMLHSNEGHNTSLVSEMTDDDYETRPRDE